MSSVLVIDDEPQILSAMTEYLSSHGHRVSCAKEKEEAEALLARSCFDVVVADLRLNGMTDVEGLEIASYVRQNCRSTRVIILTAYGSDEIQRKARDLEVDAFLHKPQPLSAIKNIIDALTGVSS